MPKTEIDYSNTIIYKITCNDINITDLYVGHTTNFVQRKHAHKHMCNNTQSHNHNCTLYSTIRQNGGWDNWKMEIIYRCNCSDHCEATDKEREYYIQLHANLNNNRSPPKQIELPPQISEPDDEQSTHICTQCTITFDDEIQLETHNQLNNHKKRTNNLIIHTPYKKMPKMPVKYNCDLCDFSCSKKSNLVKHSSTAKHQNIQNHTNSYIKNAESYKCKCGREYKHSSNYYTHKKKCIDQQTIGTDVNALSLLVLEVVKQNKELIDQNYETQKQNHELHKQFIDLYKNGTSVVNNNNTINNKTFNLNLFLNEECKDAMNIMEFVDSLQLQFSDLENVGRLGFINGISDIIIKNLKALDIHKRPVHCTDLKREVMYVKDEDQWEKEAEDNNKIRKAIKCIAQKNTKNLVLFKQKHPDCLQGDSRSSDQYNKLVREAFGGGTDKDDTTSENKIISRISKEITIDKIPFDKIPFDKIP